MGPIQTLQDIHERNLRRPSRKFLKNARPEKNHGPTLLQREKDFSEGERAKTIERLYGSQKDENKRVKRVVLIVCLGLASWFLYAFL